MVNSTLPTEPATVAPIRGGNAQPQTAATETKPRQTQPATRPERKQAVIEPKRETKPQAVVKAPEVKAPAQTKRTETATVSEPGKSTGYADCTESNGDHHGTGCHFGTSCNCTYCNCTCSDGNNQRRSRQDCR